MYSFQFKILLSSCFSILIATTALAQNTQKIDSLNSVLSNQVGINQFETIVQLAINYADNDNTKSLALIDKAYSLAAQFRDSTKIVRAGRIKGQLLRRLERIDESIALFEILLPTAKKKNLINDHKIILNSLALAYTLKADYNKALDYNFKSLVIRENDGDKAEISISLNNIGLVYFKLKNYNKAIEYYHRALLLKKEANDLYDLDRLLINLGLSYNQLMNYEKAKEYIDEALRICGSKCNSEIIIDGQFGLGVTNFGLERYSLAEKHFSESLRISQRTNNKRFQAENLVYLGRIALLNNDFEQAEKYFTQTESIASEFGYNQLLIDAYKEFSNTYNQSKNFEKASEYQKKYIALKDELIGEELVKNIAKIQTQFEERQNIATIADREEVIARQRMFNVAVVIIAILTGLLVFVLFRSNRVKQKANLALSGAKSIIELQNKELKALANNLQLEVDKATSDLKVVNASLQKVNEELDNFIYKTSHDIRGPLASLLGICNVALMDVTDPMALDYLNKLDITATKLNRILTRLLIINQITHAAINPEPLDFDTILDDIVLLETKNGLPPRLTIKREIESNINYVSDDALIRIILENLVDNSIKYYTDSSRINPFVLIKIYIRDEHINIHVVDNGLGLSETRPEKIFQMFNRASERSSTGGLGLYLIKQASTKLGGDVSLRMTPEGYTEFVVTLPLEIPVEIKTS